MSTKAKRIAVIGAGPAGLAAASYLLAEGLEVVVYERKPQPGGVWNTNAPGTCYPCPVYEALETNVPRTLLTFTDFPWPTDSSLFPKAATVNQYVQAYAAKIASTNAGCKGLRIDTRTNLTDLRKSTHHGEKYWSVIAEQQSMYGGSKKITDRFSGVVVASGNYHHADLPNTPGAAEWDNVHHGSMTHAVSFRTAEEFRGQSVLVIGNSASGWDISSQLAGVAGKVFVSSRRHDRSKGAQQLSDPSHIGVPAVLRYDSDTKTVIFADDSVHHVDKVIFCSGYKWDFSFIKKGTAQGDQALFQAGVQVANVYQHIFYSADPSLAFVGLPTMSASFTVAEAQSAVVARVLGGRLGVPNTPALQKWYQEKSQAHAAKVQAGEANPRHFHSFNLRDDKAYVNSLMKWSLETTTPTPFGDDGQPPPFWCKCLDDAREQSRPMRAVFKAKGDARHAFTTHGSLGYNLPKRCQRGQRKMRDTNSRCRACFSHDGGL